VSKTKPSQEPKRNKTINIAVDAKLHRHLKIAAFHRGMHINDLTAELLEDGFRRLRKRKRKQ
jgi:hypothetical protein